MYSFRSKQTPTERALQDEIDSLREQQERQNREEDRQREERKRERQEEWAYQARRADSWTDALYKQRALCQHEAYDDGTGVEDFFANSVVACDAAIKLWPTVESSRKAELDELRAKIAQVEEEIRLEVADKLESGEHGTGQGFKSLATELRNGDDPSAMLNW